jgi:DNA-binding CsgD family transcriptional regulator
MDESDFDLSASLLAGRLAYTPDVVAELPGVWTLLLEDHAMNAVVFENRSGSGSLEFLAFGVSVFVTDAWAAAAGSGAEPYLTARTLRAELEDGPSPILRLRDIERRPDASLNIVILHYGEAPSLEPDLARALRYRVLQEFLRTNCGYRIAEVMQEVWDEIDPEFLHEGWGNVRTDYASYFAVRGEPLPPPAQRPYLVGLSREEALREPGDLMAPLFIHTPARLSFSPAEKRVIRKALPGRTDSELAEELHIALPTVKSHWRSIYRRVHRADPDLFGSARARSSGGGRLRGKEKRRRLLEYVRRHPEELCPVDFGRPSE